MSPRVKMSQHSPSRASSRPRNYRVEALRLVAIAGIAVFHTFQKLFAHAVEASTWLGPVGPAALADAAASGGVASAAAAFPAALALLGFINLLGTFGNHVFFSISGRFLIPSMAARAGEDGYWRDAYLRTERRGAVVLFSVAWYAVFALIIDAWIFPLPGIGFDQSAWIVGGLQFIWVYLALIVLAPVLSWIWWRLGSRRMPVVAIFVLAVFAVNAYIAFVSPGEVERDLLEWRKIMSAVSYAASFISGAVVGELADWSDAGTWRRRSLVSLAAVLILCAVVEVACAYAGRADLLQALSFKSTSLLSFALALAALAVALGTPARQSSSASRASAVVARAASAILGFYILQSFTYLVWRPYADALLADTFSAVMAAGDPTLPLVAAALGVAVVAGILFAFAFLICSIAVDLLGRVSAIKAIGLR